MSAMLNVSNALKDPGQAYPFKVSVELEPMEVLGDTIAFSDIVAEGEYLCTGERVAFNGAVTANVNAHCARCLEPVRTSINAELDAVFARQADPDDPDLYLFELSKVELTDAVKDALLLALPLRFLCSEDCKGLCPVCGVNLNTGSCTCQEGEVTNPFSALKAFVQGAQDASEFEEV